MRAWPAQDASAGAPTPQAVADSVASAAGSVVRSDTVDTAATDSTDALAAFAQDVQETAEKAIEGRWAELFSDISQQFQDAVAAAMPRIASALIVLVLFYAAYRILAAILGRLLRRSTRVDNSLRLLLMRTFKAVAFAFIAITVLGQFGINVTALLAGLSIIGLAVGLAAKDTLENYISGITIFVDKPFRIGDSVEIEGVYGFVEEISMRSTRIRTLDNEVLVMPNVMMINQKLLNHAMHGVLRVQIPFGIAYKEYPQQAREVVLRTTEGDDRLHPDYPPRVAVTGLNDSSVDLVLFLWLKDHAQEVPVRQEYAERIREALREAGIEIPFPHLQLFIDEAKAFR